MKGSKMGAFRTDDLFVCIVMGLPMIYVMSVFWWNALRGIFSGVRSLIVFLLRQIVSIWEDAHA
jgi:hypothetical protein